MLNDTSMATEMAMGFDAMISGVNSLQPSDAYGICARELGRHWCR